MDGWMDGLLELLQPKNYEQVLQVKWQNTFFFTLLSRTTPRNNFLIDRHHLFVPSKNITNQFRKFCLMM